jgi:hypothetical protein
MAKPGDAVESPQETSVVDLLLPLGTWIASWRGRVPMRRGPGWVVFDRRQVQAQREGPYAPGLGCAKKTSRWCSITQRISSSPSSTSTTVTRWWRDMNSPTTTLTSELGHGSSLFMVTASTSTTMFVSASKAFLCMRGTRASPSGRWL